MSKPFVLHWFPSDSSGAYYRPGFDPKADHAIGGRNSWHANLAGGPISVAATVLRKRLTDSDLAAEMWATRVEELELSRDGYDPSPARREGEVLARFATTPHHDPAYRPEAGK